MTSAAFTTQETKKHTQVGRLLSVRAVRDRKLQAGHPSPACGRGATETLSQLSSQPGWVGPCS